MPCRSAPPVAAQSVPGLGSLTFGTPKAALAADLVKDSKSGVPPPPPLRRLGQSW